MVWSAALAGTFPGDTVAPITGIGTGGQNIAVTNHAASFDELAFERMDGRRQSIPRHGEGAERRIEVCLPARAPKDGNGGGPSFYLAELLGSASRAAGIVGARYT